MGARKRPLPKKGKPISLKPEKVLANWRAMIQSLPLMDEKQLAVALAHEKKHGKRRDFLFRIARRIATKQTIEARLRTKELVSKFRETRDA